MSMKTVLIVDDVPSAALLLSAQLKPVATSLIAHSAAEAERVIATHGAPALIILDWYLGGDTGAALLDHIADQHIPTLILSADPKPGRTAHYANCLGVLRKCSGHRAIINWVSDCLNADRQPRVVDPPKPLIDAYLTSLTQLRIRLSGPYTPDMLASTLHQLKGSSALYGFRAFHRAVTLMGETLMRTDAIDNGQVKDALIDAIDGLLNDRSAIKL